jgi:hypothetical protein
MYITATVGGSAGPTVPIVSARVLEQLERDFVLTLEGSGCGASDIHVARPEQRQHRLPLCARALRLERRFLMMF